VPDREGNIPLDFSSSVQPRSSSWTSSGSTEVLFQASSQRGLGGGAVGTGWGAPFLVLLIFAGPSLLFSLEKRPGMVDGGVRCYVGEYSGCACVVLECKYFRQDPGAARYRGSSFGGATTDNRGRRAAQDPRWKYNSPFVVSGPAVAGSKHTRRGGGKGRRAERGLLDWNGVRSGAAADWRGDGERTVGCVDESVKAV
jgi:hypothetical protein